MILSPFLSLNLRPKLSTWIKQTRSIRPTIKIAKDKFQLSLDVHSFKKDEIRVKARPEYVIIEGKQEKKMKTGFVLRQFVRKFKLPEGCNPGDMESKLSSDGILTITAPRKVCEANLPCETLIPISYAEPQEEEKFLEVQDIKSNPCAKVKDVKDGSDKKAE